MKMKLIKGVVAVLSLSTAVAMTYQSNPKAANAEANAKSDQSKNDLLITSPSKASEYGVGSYRVEGLVPKGSNVTLYLDRKELKTLEANKGDGSFLEDIDVKEAGNHTLVAEYKDAKGERVLRKLEFKSSSEKNPAPEKGPDLVAEKNPDETPDVDSNKPLDSDDDVKYPDAPEKSAEVPVKPAKEVAPKPAAKVMEDPKDPNAEVHRKANGVKDAKPEAKKPATKVAAKPAGKLPFAISSYANFNVVPHGVLQIGGKGKPGDKVVLLVDNKPSMKGTIKPNGRWKFPVKIATAGFRTITAKNLTTKEVKTIKLKIK